MSTFDGLLDAECNDLYDGLVSSIVHQNSNAFDFPKMPYFVVKSRKYCISQVYYPVKPHFNVDVGWLVGCGM